MGRNKKNLFYEKEETSKNIYTKLVPQNEDFLVATSELRFVLFLISGSTTVRHKRKTNIWGSCSTCFSQAAFFVTLYR